RGHTRVALGRASCAPGDVAGLVRAGNVSAGSVVAVAATTPDPNGTSKVPFLPKRVRWVPTQAAHLEAMCPDGSAIHSRPRFASSLRGGRTAMGIGGNPTATV